jgi:hypothetical protein
VTSRERKELTAHVPRSGTTMHTGCATVLGLPVLVAGIFILLVAAGRVTGVRTYDTPPALIAILGGLFTAGGFSGVASGIRGMIRAARVRRGERERPKEPWCWEHPWRPEGATTGGVDEQLNGLIGLMFLAMFLVPFNWFAFSSGGLPSILIVGLFDFILLVVTGMMAYRFARWIRYGRSRLRFASFPFVLGGTLEAYLEGADQIRSFRSLVLTLRCVQEVYETRRGRRNRVSMSYFCYQIYEDSQTWTPASAPGDVSEMRIRFALPDETEYQTRLRDIPPRYWELEVAADTPGIDYKATFLVPVYKSGS